MKSRLNDFAFKGLFAAYCIKDLRILGTLRSPAHSNQERLDHDMLASVPEQIRSGAVEMQRYYKFMFVFENLLRAFVSDRFSEVDGELWFEKRASTKMKDKVEQRRKDEAENSWHCGRNKDPLYCLDFGDLSLLIKNHWNVFEDLLPSQDWVASRINETERTRNVIAHTGLLPAEEGARLEMHFRDWVKQVG